MRKHFLQNHQAIRKRTLTSIYLWQWAWDSYLKHTLFILWADKTLQTEQLLLTKAGAVAGISVDLVLYPLDTLKTRLQSAKGFHQVGGFNSVYRGLTAVMTTSMPITSLFFFSYETTKRLVEPYVPGAYTPVVHMFAASVGEVLACVLRVPAEIAKQRKQTYTGKAERSNLLILVDAYRKEGLRKGLYRGYGPTVVRDIPFSFIQLPVWEMLKAYVKEHNDGQISGLQSAMCGSLAGGFAATLTTPLDLAKTRIVLADHKVGRLRITPVLTNIYIEFGVKGLFFGVLPRASAFFIGGFVYFGAYESCKRFFESSF